MAMHPFGNRPATGTGSSWRGCTGGDHHIVGHSDLLDNQVGKVGNYSHRLTLVWEKVLSEGSVLSLSIPHVSSSRLRKNHNLLHDYCHKLPQIALAPASAASNAPIRPM